LNSDCKEKKLMVDSILFTKNINFHILWISFKKKKSLTLMLFHLNITLEIRSNLENVLGFKLIFYLQTNF
jgi:hypothetical protein